MKVILFKKGIGASIGVQMEKRTKERAWGALRQILLLH